MEEPKTSRPVIPSQLSVQWDTDEWTERNQVSYIKDNEDSLWEIKKRVTHKPHATNPKEFVWEISCFFNCTLSKQELIETKILDPIEDERLLSFLTQESVTLQSKPIVVQDLAQIQAEKKLRISLMNFKDKLIKTNTREMKRQLLFRWIDDKCCFKTPI